MEEKVSIISPVYNGQKYINAFLESVLYQTYSNIELIVIDDASTDNTEDIINDYIPRFANKGYSLFYYKQEVNKGQAAAINVGLKKITGEYVTWMDSDDIFYPFAIEKKAEFLKKNVAYDLVLNWGEIVLEEDINTPIGYLKRNKPVGEDGLFKDLLDERNVVFGPGTIMVKSSSLRNAIPDLEIYESREGQNWQLMLPLAYSCKIGYLDEILFKYVVHNDSHSHAKMSYKRKNERRDNFFVLQSETINRILGMSEDEKDYWKDYSYNKQLFEKYMNAVRCHKYKDSRKLKEKLLNQNKCIKFEENIFIYDLCNVIKIVKRKIKKVLVS